MGDFTPGVERARAAGYKITVGAYPDGAQGVRLSLDVIARKIRDGRLDPDIRGWAGDVLIAAGKPKSVRGKCVAILDAFRQATMYVADPVGAEYIASGGATLCLRPGLCVRARDCDDGVTAVGSSLMSVGIPVRVVKQNFGANRQEHVLIEAQDENGMWLAVDPSTELPVGEKVRAVSEQRRDPMDTVGSAGTSGAEIVTLGAVPESLMTQLTSARILHFDGKRFSEKRYGRWWVQPAGLGSWIDVGVGDACCASCASGAPCEGSPAPPVPASTLAAPLIDPADDDLDAPCSSCELYAERLRRRGLAGTPIAASLMRRAAERRMSARRPGAYSIARPGVGAAAVTSPAIPPARLGGAAAVGITALVAIAGGIGLAIGARR